MADLNVRSDSVDVEQIMKQIRTRIREKRGTDYTDAELQQLASVKLEQFADPSGLRSDLLVQFQQRSSEPSTYHRHRGPRRWLLMLLHPLLKRIQKQLMSDLNLYFEIIHNLVVEVTRLGIEVQNLKMRVESLSSRVDFDERRGRALEGVVQYRPDALPRPRPQDAPRPGSGNAPAPPAAPAAAGPISSGSPGAPTPVPTPAAAAAPVPAGSSNTPVAPGTEGGNRPNDQNRPDGSRRRRRRRRRRPGHTLADSPLAGNGQPGGNTPPAGQGPAPGHQHDGDDGPDDDDGAPDQ
jgi:hypothetical protein